VAAVCVTTTACSGSRTTTPEVGVILPGSPRFASADGPRLRSAFDDAGVRAEIRNTRAGPAGFGAICDSMVKRGVQVLLIVSPDPGTGTACLKEAKAAGISSIDYDRLTVGGGASYLVSFDDVRAGELMGRGLITCLDKRHKTSANVVYVDGDPTDEQAALLKVGYAKALRPKIDSGAYRLVGDETGLASRTTAGSAFEALYARNRGRIDGVVAGDDTMAGGIIGRLEAHRVARAIPVTGQGATVAGLRAVLDGSQCMTVFENTRLESKAAADLATALVHGDTAKVHALTADAVEDTETGKNVPAVLVRPRAIFQHGVSTVISDRPELRRSVCAGRLADLCARYGVS
jgi:D-xylose transport system substrate-binding protein